MPARHLVRSVSVVCKLWRDVLRLDSTFWERHCAANNQLLPPGAPSPSWAKLAIHRPLRRDLVAVPTVLLDGSWTFRPGVTTNWEGGRGWAREAPEAGPPCLASSHYECHALKQVDLSRMGVPPGTWLTIEIAIETSARHDCGGTVPRSYQPPRIHPRPITVTASRFLSLVPSSTSAARQPHPWPGSAAVHVPTLQRRHVQ